jgi:hypothetical protein
MKHGDERRWAPTRDIPIETQRSVRVRFGERTQWDFERGLFIINEVGCDLVDSDYHVKLVVQDVPMLDINALAFRHRNVSTGGFAVGCTGSGRELQIEAKLVPGQSSQPSYINPMVTFVFFGYAMSSSPSCPPSVPPMGPYR